MLKTMRRLHSSERSAFVNEHRYSCQKHPSSRTCNSQMKQSYLTNPTKDDYWLDGVHREWGFHTLENVDFFIRTITFFQFFTSRYAERLYWRSSPFVIECGGSVFVFFGFFLEASPPLNPHGGEIVERKQTRKICLEITRGTGPILWGEIKASKSFLSTSIHIKTPLNPPRTQQVEDCSTRSEYCYDA